MDAIRANTRFRIRRTIRSPSGAGISDADALPVGVMVRNGEDDIAVTVTVASVTGLVGRYKLDFTVPGDYSVGDDVAVELRATVDGVSDAFPVWEAKIAATAFEAPSESPGTYCTRDDLELRFGRSNVEKWADHNNDGDLTEIDERVEWACEQAYSDINDELRGGPYDLPVSPLPSSLVDLSSRWAAALLNEWKMDESEESEKKRVGPSTEKLKRILRRVRAGALRFSGVAYGSALYPQVIARDVDPAILRQQYLADDIWRRVGFSPVGYADRYDIDDSGYYFTP